MSASGLEVAGSEFIWKGLEVHLVWSTTGLGSVSASGLEGLEFI